MGFEPTNTKVLAKFEWRSLRCCFSILMFVAELSTGIS